MNKFKILKYTENKELNKRILRNQIIYSNFNIYNIKLNPLNTVNYSNSHLKGLYIYSSNQRLCCLDKSLYISIDTEYTKINSLKNNVISYQVWIYYKNSNFEINEGFIFITKSEFRLSLKFEIDFLIRYVFSKVKKIDLVFVICHFSRAEFFSSFRLDYFFKYFKRVSYIQKTFASTSFQKYYVWDNNNNKKEIQIYFADTYLLSNYSSLKVLGEFCGLEKVNIGECVTNIRKLLKSDFSLFVEYSVTDCLVCLSYFLKFLEMLQELGLKKIPSTLSQISELVFINEIAKYRELMGYEKIKKVVST